MAEGQNPVTQGELVEIVRRLDERISSMDRNLNDRLSNMEKRFDERFDGVNQRFDAVDQRFASVDQRLSEMRTDLRMLNRAVIGFYGGLLAVAGILFTLYKLFPNTPPTP